MRMEEKKRKRRKRRRRRRGGDFEMTLRLCGWELSLWLLMLDSRTRRSGCCPCWFSLLLLLLLLLFLLFFLLLVFSTAPRWTAPAWTPLTLHGPFKSFNGSKIYLCYKKYWEFTTSPTGGIYGYLVSRFVAGSVSSAAQTTEPLWVTLAAWIFFFLFFPLRLPVCARLNPHTNESAWRMVSVLSSLQLTVSAIKPWMSPSICCWGVNVTTAWCASAPTCYSQLNAELIAVCLSYWMVQMSRRILARVLTRLVPN